VTREQFKRMVELSGQLPAQATTAIQESGEEMVAEEVPNIEQEISTDTTKQEDVVSTPEEQESATQ